VKEDDMDGTLVEAVEAAAVDTPVGASGMDGADLARLQEQLRAAEERVTALEASEAVLRAQEARRLVTDTLAGLRFGEHGAVLAPASRGALTEALMPLEAGARSAVLEALRGQQFVVLGERGFAEGEGETALTASEEERVRGMAERTGLPFEEVKAQFVEVRRRRGGGV